MPDQRDAFHRNRLDGSSDGIGYRQEFVFGSSFEYGVDAYGFLSPRFTNVADMMHFDLLWLLQIQHGIPNFERDRNLMLHWSWSTVAWPI